MTTDFQYIARLIQSFHDGTLSDTQKAELESWIMEDENRRELVSNANEWTFLKEELSLYHSARKNSSPIRTAAIQQSVHERIRPNDYRLKRFYLPIAASLVACCLLFLWIAASYFLQKQDRIKISLTDPALAFSPESDKATIILPNGENISLLDEENSLVMGETITHTDGSDLKEIKDLILNDNTILTLKTPPKGNYHVKLSDGSEVWLNENSILRYPVKFGNGDRVVELVGEGFFEIQKDKNAKSFLVKSSDQTISVLGTKFNLSTSSEDHLTKTTLVEGKIALHSELTTQQLIVMPNQQAIFNGKNFQRKNVNVEPFIAWRSGNFYFDGGDPTMALNEISNWYDIKIVSSKIPKLSFFGYIEKSTELATVLKILKDSGLQFTVQRKEGQLLLKIINE